MKADWSIADAAHSLARGTGREAREVARDALEERTSEALEAFSDSLNERLDTEIGSIRVRYPLDTMCKEGCSACCHLRTYVTPPEALSLARAARSSLERGQLSLLQRRARRTARRVASLDATEHSRQRVACPLLQDDRCLVHDARPIPCRSMFSADAAACGGGPDTPVPRHGIALIFGSAVQAGVALGAGDRELDAAPVELSAALVVALRADSERRWLSGEAVFAGARVRDAFLKEKRLPVLL